MILGMEKKSTANGLLLMFKKKFSLDHIMFLYITVPRITKARRQGGIRAHHPSDRRQNLHLEKY